MKTPSASSFTRPRRALLAAGGSLAFFLLPFVLFHPEKKPVVPNHTSKRSIEYLSPSRRAALPGLNRFLAYHDPRLFLFPDEKCGFALFRVRPDVFEPSVASEVHSDLLFPARSSESPRPSMTPSPLPRSEAAFSAPLSAASFPIEAGPVSSPEPDPAGTAKFAPMIRSASGQTLPGSQITAFSESEILSLHPQGPTRLLAEPPALPDLPGYAEILGSCGVSRLDVEACRLLNLLLQDAACPARSSGPEIFTVYWLPPQVSSEFSAKLREDKEEEPGT